MMFIVHGVRQATLRVKCPHCGAIQLCTKQKAKQGTHACKRCHKPIRL